MTGPREPDETPRSEPFVRLAKLPPLRGAGEGTSASYEERTGALIRRAAFPAGLDQPSLARVWQRLEVGGAARRRVRLTTVVRACAAGIVLLISSAVVGAETGVWTWPRVVVQRLSNRAPAVDMAPAARTPARKVARAHPAPAAPAPAPPPSFVQDHGPAPSAPPSEIAPPGRPRSAALRVTAPVPSVAPDTRPPPVVGDSTLAEESAVLGRALAHLRQRHDAAGALAELDRYGAHFPSGMLVDAADRARVDALLMAHRLVEARALLSRLTLGAGGRDLELRVIRAELTAGTAAITRDACASALRDYEVVLADRRDGALAERALWGRAACRSRLGDDAGARADLADYLQRFPTGPNAGIAAARLRPGGQD